VGFGIGKAGDTAMAIDKAVRMAKKDMVHVKRTENNSIPHDTQAKYNASEVLLRPVWGKGLAAGGAVRVVLEMAGIDEVGGKLLTRSKNNINNAKATLEALKPFATNSK
jgi:small subunit ribosomal protein S5